VLQGTLRDNWHLYAFKQKENGPTRCASRSTPMRSPSPMAPLGQRADRRA
jgi:hypothetical protein